MSGLSPGNAALAMRDRIRKFGQMFNDAGYRGKHMATDEMREENDEVEETNSGKEESLTSSSSSSVSQTIDSDQSGGDLRAKIQKRAKEEAEKKAL